VIRLKFLILLIALTPSYSKADNRMLSPIDDPTIAASAEIIGTIEQCNNVDSVKQQIHETVEDVLLTRGYRHANTPFRSFPNSQTFLRWYINNDGPIFFLESLTQSRISFIAYWRKGKPQRQEEWDIVSQIFSDLKVNGLFSCTTHLAPRP